MGGKEKGGWEGQRKAGRKEGRKELGKILIQFLRREKLFINQEKGQHLHKNRMIYKTIYTEKKIVVD